MKYKGEDAEKFQVILHIWLMRESGKERVISRGISDDTAVSMFSENWGQCNGLSSKTPSEESYFPQEWLSTSTCSTDYLAGSSPREGWLWHRYESVSWSSSSWNCWWSMRAPKQIWVSSTSQNVLQMSPFFSPERISLISFEMPF